MTDASTEKVLAELSLAEKCTMVVGRTAWVVPGCERLGVPEWCVSDGPVGVRGRAQGPGLVVPGPSALGASWDVELVGEVGAALGVEARDRKVDLLLAPTVNIHRVPRGGRHFECYSEDPFLSARIAVAYIEGVQRQGVGACVKHFVANDQEYERRTIDCVVDERALREIYLPPFEAAVTEAGVRSVMAAYNFVNGIHACAHEPLLRALLKDEWGFEGFVVSDWYAMKDTLGPANAGLDLEMPGPGVHWGRGQLEAAVVAGDVDVADLDDKVRRILDFLAWCGRIGTPTDHAETSTERPEHRELARRAAVESMVLVRNEHHTLPIASDTARSWALIGPAAAQTAALGGGSASLTPHRRTSVVDALAARLGDSGQVRHAPGVSLRRRARDLPMEWVGPHGATVELFDGDRCMGEPVATESGRGLFNVWMADSWPDGIDTLSVRVSATVTPPDSGRFRFAAVGFGRARLFIDGDLVADNGVDGYSAGIGMRAGDGVADLVGGRSYLIVLEHTPTTSDQWLVLTRIGAEPVVDHRGELIAEAVDAARDADVAVVVVGTSEEWETEGDDREALVLPAGQDELIAAVAAVNSRTIVVLNCGAPVLMEWYDDVAVVLVAWFAGQEGGEAIVDVLLGDAEPGGRMPTTWARREQDTPAFTSYPGEAGKMHYGEGIYVGYRWYDRRGIEPLVPFGFGLGYADLAWGEATVTGRAPRLTVEIPVTNVGDRAGSEVVQCYVVPPARHRGATWQLGAASRPEQCLAGFAKLHLEPGARATASITLDERAFARWDTATKRWFADPGTYELRLGASSRDVRASVAVELDRGE